MIAHRTHGAAVTRALRRAFGAATVRVPPPQAAAGTTAVSSAPVFHPPGVIRVVTPAELAAADTVRAGAIS